MSLSTVGQRAAPLFGWTNCRCHQILCRHSSKGDPGDGNIAEPLGYDSVTLGYMVQPPTSCRGKDVSSNRIAN